MKSTSECAEGKWKSILETIFTKNGIDPVHLNGRHHPCPRTGAGIDRFRFSDKHGGGNYFCDCSEGKAGGMELVMCVLNQQFKHAAAEVDAITGRNPEFDEPKKVNYSEILRRTAKSAPRSKYLESRGLEMAPGLQFSGAVDYRNGEEDGDRCLSLAAMLAPVTRNGEFLTYHVTYLQDGKKADVKIPRKILPPAGWVGGAVELFPRNGPCLGVAEGIETAIAAHMLHRTIPVWSVLNTSGMKGWVPPDGIESVVIFADNDLNYAGHAAAYALAHKIYGKVAVEIWMPPTPGEDWNNVLNARQKAGTI